MSMGSLEARSLKHEARKKMQFKLHADYKPTGDQPQAIEKLVSGVLEKKQHQVLLGVTGSGKTFTIANVIEKVQKPTLVISHNKTLAAQLYQEFREFFPENAVEYFVSYYDYYQPEAYIPQTDTYIEKDADINEEIDKLRLSTTSSLMSRRDVIVVASVSCIYGLGSPIEYSKQTVRLNVGEKVPQSDIVERLFEERYEREDYDFSRGKFRLRGDSLEIWPSYSTEIIRIDFTGSLITDISARESVSGKLLRKLNSAVIFPAKHYLTSEEHFKKALEQIEVDLEKQVTNLKKLKKPMEAYRVEQRTKYDLEMIREVGYCSGVENYSRYFDGRGPGDPPFTLLDFFGPKTDDWLCVIDESHMTVPQVRGMYNGDRARKLTLVDYGFRLPSCVDNRPLTFSEFEERVPQTIYTSATPDSWEVEKAGGVIEQLVRPTGLLDPKITVLPSENQIGDLIERIKAKTANKERVLVTTLTKRMAEELSAYLSEKGLLVQYLHSDVKTLERSDVLDKLRKGEYDVLVGINLLREGLDLPEVGLVAILDADKEGFLRSQTSLVQVMGRAARNVSGEVVMYADKITGSMKRAIDEVNRRRKNQEKYNLEHGITPKTISKPIRKALIEVIKDESLDLSARNLPPKDREVLLSKMEKEMKEAAEVLDFERAAEIRDAIKEARTRLDIL